MHSGSVRINEEKVHELRRPSRYGYPWNEWLDGTWWMIPWDGLPQNPDKFRGLAYKQASRRGLTLQCYKAVNNTWLMRSSDNGSDNSDNR